MIQGRGRIVFWLLVISSLSLRSIVTPPPATHYSDFDYKVMDYMGRLDMEDTVKSTINQSMQQRYCLEKLCIQKLYFLGLI